MNVNKTLEISKEEFVEKWQEAEAKVLKEVETDDVVSRLISFLGCKLAVDRLFPEGADTASVTQDGLIEELAHVAHKASTREGLNPDAGFAMILILGLISSAFCHILFREEAEEEDHEQKK